MVCRGRSVEAAKGGCRPARVAVAVAVAVTVAVAGEGGPICWNRSLEAENSGALNCQANESDGANLFLYQRRLVPIASKVLEYPFHFFIL